MYLLKSGLIAIASGSALFLGGGGIDGVVGQSTTDNSTTPTSPCGICKSSCMETDPENPGPCKGKCHDDGICEGEGGGGGGSSHSHDHSDSDRIPGTEECGICKHACADDDIEILESIFGVGTTFESSGSCKGSCSDIYGEDKCMCGGRLCSESDGKGKGGGGSHDHHDSHDHGGSSSECGACKGSCEEMFDDCPSKPDGSTTECGTCKAECETTFGDCGKKGGKDKNKDSECGKCKKECSDTLEGDAVGPCKGTCEETHDDCGSKGGGSHDHSDDGSSSECGKCKGNCADTLEGDAIGPCKGQCEATYDDCNKKGGKGKGGSHDHHGSHDHGGNGSSSECGKCKGECADTLEGDAVGPCKGQCEATYDDCGKKGGKGKNDSHDHHGSHDHGDGGSSECGACKGSCEEMFDDCPSKPDGSTTECGTCKGECEATYDDCGKKGGKDKDPTSPCGICKSSCMETDPENPGPCKGKCHDDGICEGEGKGSGKDSDDDGAPTIGELTCGSPDFTVLCSLIEACPTDDIEGPLTVFAPNDLAFAELDAAVGGLANVDPDILCGIFQFHIVAGEEIYSTDLVEYCESGDASLLGMANGIDSRIKCTKDVPYGIKGGGNDEPANFVDVDIVVSDGVVHVIDNVLFYPRVFGGGAISNVVPSLRGIDLP